MITFSGVSLIYPNSQRTIIEDLSFTVNEGEMVLLIGHTGAGKSSILKLINGLVPHHTGGILSGEITVAGRSTRLLKPGQLADIVGVVGQNPSHGFVCDYVEDEIAFTMENLGFSPDSMRKRVEEVLDLLGLASLRRREIATLSGGEQQRVAIASALVTQPQVLLLDEPTSALDPIAAEEVLSILSRLVHDLGLTVVLAEHRLERVIQFVDRILLIDGSGGASLGEARDILKRSPIAPPIIELSRLMELPEMPLSIREFRKASPALSPDKTSSAKENHINRGEELVRFEGVCATYDKNGATYALNDVTLSLFAGEVTALMGRNGAGKTTLLKSTVGASPISRGSVRICGEDPVSWSAKDVIAKVGYIPQEPGDLLYKETVRDECLLADSDNGLAPGTTLNLYRRLMAIPSESARIREISEGQRLGLALSIVLGASPRVVVLDEPTRGLDYAAKKVLISILRDLAHGEGKSVIVSTHDVEFVAELADRVIFIAEGELIADGNAHEILTSSPAFAPQVAKALPDRGWISIRDVEEALKSGTE